jgi:hypothetical protein
MTPTQTKIAKFIAKIIAFVMYYFWQLFFITDVFLLLCINQYRMNAVSYRVRQMDSMWKEQLQIDKFLRDQINANKCAKTQEHPSNNTPTR